MDLSTKIEAVLFWRGEPVKIKKLAAILSVSEDKIREAADKLSESLSKRGIVMQAKDDELTLGTSPELSDLFVNLAKEELREGIGKAALETLAIILYKNPISRRELDYIRGVNSTFIVRSLMVRGLIERTEKKGSDRSYVYRPTFELLGYLGLKKPEDLPEYEKVREEIREFEKQDE